MPRASRFVWIKIFALHPAVALHDRHELRASCGLKYYIEFIEQQQNQATSFALRVD